ncbi:hypothetical protein FKG94_19650 [Exilibacterium tricleocarpae]|uniref:Uncharacterized protein n=1 Tax=Exilibacterium tricleocarpae TaxID=2591008 RepID=A0A545T290_9GAMM|nr:hypothetical protein [Exilibacterium tricleocarpae]TQV71331.1 hypothetical protein FKG94_19650 [Exilibacterium tricleocarpae]
MLHQFKTLDDLRNIIKEFEGYLARPTRRFSHPTLYRKRDVQDGDTLVKGVRKKDWLFSEDGQWILAHDQMGLSFSSRWQHLKGVYKMKEKHNQGAVVDVYWILEEADLPPKMKFVPDRGKKGHYLLTVTERITLQQLVDKLKWVADRMSVIRNAEKAL